MIIVCIVAIIVLPDASMYYRRLKLKFETLPEVYKSYSTLDSIKDDYYEVIEFENDGREFILQLNDSTIVIIGGSSKEM